MPLVHDRTFRVRRYECDAYGHLNHANCLRTMQETAFDASAAVGHDMPCCDALGYRWLSRETEIETLHPLQHNDLVQARAPGWLASHPA